MYQSIDVLDDVILFTEKEMNLCVMKAIHEYTCECDGLYSFITEAGEQDTGFFGFVKKIFRGIIGIFERGISAISKFFTGKEINHNKDNVQVKLGKDPDIVAKFISGDIKSSKEYLDKIRAGKVSKEEAMQFVQRQNSAFDAIKPGLKTLGSLAPLVAISTGIMGKWKKEAAAIYDDLEAKGENTYASKVANTYGAENKDQAARSGAEQIIASHMSESANKGIKYLLSLPKIMYANQYFTNRIKQEANEANSSSGLASRIMRDGKEIVNTKVAEQKEKIKNSNRNAYAAVSGALSRAKHNAKDSYGNTMANSYNNVQHTPDHINTKADNLVDNVKAKWEQHKQDKKQAQEDKRLARANKDLASGKRSYDDIIV